MKNNVFPFFFFLRNSCNATATHWISEFDTIITSLNTSCQEGFFDYKIQLEVAGQNLNSSRYECEQRLNGLSRGWRESLDREIVQKETLSRCSMANHACERETLFLREKISSLEKRVKALESRTYTTKDFKQKWAFKKEKMEEKQRKRRREQKERRQRRREMKKKRKQEKRKKKQARRRSKHI